MKKVCKTFMRRFDPGPRLQSFNNLSFTNTSSTLTVANTRATERPGLAFFAECMPFFWRVNSRFGRPILPMRRGGGDGLVRE